jgi:hypothetical protein
MSRSHSVLLPGVVFPGSSSVLISDCEASLVSVDVRDLDVQSYARVSAIESYA